MFPQKSKKQAKSPKGKRRPLKAFKAPPHIEAYLDARVADGYKITEVIVRLLDCSIDLTEELGPEWYEVERIAMGDGVTAGTATGRLVREALAARRKNGTP